MQKKQDQIQNSKFEISQESKAPTKFTFLGETSISYFQILFFTCDLIFSYVFLNFLNKIILSEKFFLFVKKFNILFSIY